ncbi:SUMF1/EgtB/PvdO family nonheme iron enzyme [Algoriphagus winogradskyi]|uniref:Formylglycine-generating enzyme, required for sulfatase activity, contains SUMF1/FGE domain n=1 Tax=Algoriphagus winogradskyi TaxID=237017 RepID=A0ABY1PH68_9BACT|nr:SUMF1/EgtB/PvdO family nonheme iron enzyme [Algoriphagus winogradskyi]SMP34200.1 Formylglycine-generating enzyme, required for sulfatase activity, contains SUMF1/FGE domain [Algoriphagus winogradskyi]
MNYLISIVSFLFLPMFESDKMVVVSNTELGYDFMIDTHEVTMAEFEKFVSATGFKSTCETRGTGPKPTGDSPSELVEGLNWRHNQDGKLIDKKWYAKLPVTRVTITDVKAYCKWVGKRLPTVREWKIAAAGGVWPPVYKYSGSNKANSVGWYDTNSKMEIQPVGTLAPNQLGVYDMSGNVEEFALLEKNGTVYHRIGGRFFSDKDMMAIEGNYSFDLSNTEFSSPFLGFRLVKDVPR